MSYLDQIRKQIAKDTGLTGVEAGHIVKDLERSGQDYQAFDWKTIGEDMYGKSHSVGSVRKQVKSMYGVGLGDISDQYSDLDSLIHATQSSRTVKAREMDNRINARRTYKTSNKKGVQRWLRRPNMYDLLGIDDKL